MVGATARWQPDTDFDVGLCADFSDHLQARKFPHKGHTGSSASVTRGMTTRPSPSHLLEVIVIIVSSWYKILDGRNLYSECAWWAAMSDGSRLLELMRCGAAIPREREMVYLSPTAPRNRNTHFSIRQIPMKPMHCNVSLSIMCARMRGWTCTILSGRSTQPHSIYVATWCVSRMETVNTDYIAAPTSWYFDNDWMRVRPCGFVSGQWACRCSPIHRENHRVRILPDIANSPQNSTVFCPL